MALGNSSKDTTQLSRKTGTRKTTAPAPSTRAAAPRSYCAALPYVGFLVACCLATFLAGARWKGAALASLDSLDPVVRRDARLDAAQNPSIVLGGSATAALSSFRGGGGGAGGVDGGAATFSRGAAPGGPVTAPPSHVNTRVNNSRPSTMAVRPMSEEAMNFCDNVNTARQSTMRQLGAAAQAAQAVLATVCRGERGGGGGGGGGGGSVRSPAATSTTVTLPPWSSAAPGGFEGAVAKDTDEDVSAATATFSSARGRDPPLALPPLPPLPVPGEPERKGRAHGAPPEFGHASHHRAAPERAEATQTVPAGAGGVAGGKRAGEGAAAAANATRSSAAVFERNVSPAPNASVPGVTSGEEGGVGPSRADSQRGVASWLSGAKEGGVRVERQLRAEARRLSGECASCTGSFFLKQGACSPWTVNCDVLGKVEANAATNSADAVCGADKTCLCATGTANTGTSCPTNGATSCRDADTVKCLSTCGHSGPCSWCDKVGLAGKCCRKDFNGGEKGCLAEEGGAGQHACVAAVAGSGWDDVVTIGVDNSWAKSGAVVGVVKRILLDQQTSSGVAFSIPEGKHIIIEGAVDDGKGGKGQATIDGGHFELGGNYVAGSGWIFGGTLELVNVRLIGGKKGSIYNYGGTVLVRDSRLESNVGGAAISTLWGASTTIISTVLANNGAGAILTERGGTVSLSDVTFVDNTGRDIWFKNYMSALFFFDRPSKFQKTGGTYDYDANILIDPNTVVYKVSATSPCPTGTSGTYTYACPIGTSGPDIWYVDGGRMFVTDESIADRSNPYPCPIGTIGSFRRPQFKVALNLANVNIVSFPTAPTCATCSGSGKYNDQTGQGDYHCHKSNGKKLYGPSKDCAANKPIDCCDPDIPEMTCKECPPGKVAAADTRASCVQNDCDAGKYAAVGGCTDCQKGRYRSESKHSNAECVLCGIGKYSDAEGATTCASCGEGKSVEPGAGIGIASCDDCSAGKFAAMAGDPEGCQDCFTGWYTADTGALVCKLCPAGKSHLLGERGEKVLANCKQCPVGKIGTPDASAAGTSGCQPCTEAKTDYQDEPGKGTCKVCRPGLQSNQNNDGCTCALPCDPGSYLEASSITCKPCPIGTFNPSYGIVGTESCLKCPAGRWSADTARPSLSGCTQCERGKKGPNNGQTTVNACVLCASGTEYQDEPGKALCKSAACAKGTWGSSADTTVPPVCTACPAGKFNAARGLTSQEECSDCGLGRWSDTLGATGPNDCTLCGTGKYSISEGASQQSACISCSNGRYQNSKGGAFCAACAAGMYGDKPGQSSSAGSCTSCPAGKYSGATGLTGPHLCNACRPGTWLDAVGSTDPSDCKACDKGKASEAVGAAAESTCKGCLVGIQYQDESGKAVCKNMACPAGKYSTSGAVADVKSTCADCPKGTFSGLIGLTDISDCNDCSTGRYGDEVAQTRSVDCKLCAAGSSNPHSKKATSGSCKACGKGTYQPEAGQATCVACAKGTYGTTESETNPDKCNLCEKGKYGSAESKQQCDACPLGRYNNLRGSTAFDDCIQCPAGTYGSLPAETTKKCAGLCPWGTFSAMVGLTDRADCKLCSLGTYEDEAGQNSTTGCKVCPAGRANPVTGSTKAGDCVLCEKGTFQATNGAALCTQCPKGQYGDQVGQTSKAAACKLCLEGTYGSSLGGQTCDLCPAGRYSSSVGSMGFDGCVLCAGGTYGKRERERWREKCTHTTHT